VVAVAKKVGALQKNDPALSYQVSFSKTLTNAFQEVNRESIRKSRVGSPLRGKPHNTQHFGSKTMR
jgi:hypothetical protein